MTEAEADAESCPEFSVLVTEDSGTLGVQVLETSSSLDDLEVTVPAGTEVGEY